jgi:hypothetical protein
VAENGKLNPAILQFCGRVEGKTGASNAQILTAAPMAAAATTAPNEKDESHPPQRVCLWVDTSHDEQSLRCTLEYTHHCLRLQHERAMPLGDDDGAPRSSSSSATPMQARYKCTHCELVFTSHTYERGHFAHECPRFWHANSDPMSSQCVMPAALCIGCGSGAELAVAPRDRRAELMAWIEGYRQGWEARVSSVQ